MSHLKVIVLCVAGNWTFGGIDQKYRECCAQRPPVGAEGLYPEVK